MMTPRTHADRAPAALSGAQHRRCNATDLFICLFAIISHRRDPLKTEVRQNDPSPTFTLNIKIIRITPIMCIHACNYVPKHFAGCLALMDMVMGVPITV